MKRLLAFLTVALLTLNSIPYPQLMMKTAILKVPDRTGTEAVNYDTRSEEHTSELQSPR